MIDLGQYDARRTTPSSDEEADQVHARFKARLDAYIAELESQEAQHQQPENRHHDKRN